MIFPDEEKWVPICKTDEDGEICFTSEYLDLTKDLGWEARRFVSHLITHWTPEFQDMLDYFGSDEDEEDKYSGVDGEPMDVREDKTDVWEYEGMPRDGLDAEWYRDVLRCKLLTLKLPERIIKEYVRVTKKDLFG